MIKALFYRTRNGLLKGFLITGHANFSEYGRDVVCAGVSSAVSMCCNGVLQLTDEKIFVVKKAGMVELKTNSKEKVVQSFLQALRMQICVLKKDYEKNIEFKELEVL